MSRPFHIFTIGWEPSLIGSLTTPVGERTGIHFSHGLVGDAHRVHHVSKELLGIDFVALSKSKREALPAPDPEMLASIESAGVPTIRSMVRGDRVLRNRHERVSLGYATLLAERIRNVLQQRRPDVVLGSFDSMHAAVGLAVAKSLDIPWVAMSFTTIPSDLTGFCRGLTPDTLVPIVRPVDESLLQQAREIAQNLRLKRQKVLAYRPPASWSQRSRQLLEYARNLSTRLLHATQIGHDEFCFPTIGERFGDIARRFINKLRLPSAGMLTAPPAGGFVFFPLHMSPESSIDTWAPFYQDQLAFAATLSRALPIDMELVVKLHFSDPDNYSRRELLRLMSLPRVRIAHPEAASRSFLERAGLVVGIQGTSCLEATLLGRPVLIFGDSPYQHFPRTERAERFDKLHEQIRRMLRRPAATEDEVVAAFAAYMARYMPGRVNDWYSAIEAKDMDRLCDCFRALRYYLESPGVRASWYNEPPFVPVEAEAA